MMRAGGSERRWIRAAVSAGLFVLAVAVRALPWPTMRWSEAVVPSSWDAFYHLRRIAWGVVHFPAVLDFDPYLNFPRGAKPIWSPAFDWVVAALARPLVGVSDLDALAAWVIWAPPLLGGATVVALTAVLWRPFGARVAVLSGATLAVLPAHFWYSQLGFVDHHAAVALVATLALGGALGMLRTPPPSPLRTATWGLALAACLLVWPGALLHVALLDVAVFVRIVTSRAEADAVARARGFAWAHAVGLAALWPLCAGNSWPQWGGFSPVVLTSFQPWLFAWIAALAGGCALLWRRTPLGASPGRRIALAALLGGLGLLASLVAQPGLLEGAGDALRWLARRERFQSQVAESLPLLAGAGAWWIAAQRLSLFVFAAPAAIAFAALRVRGRPDAGRVRLMLWWTAGLLAATLAQRRFFNTYALGQAWLFAWCLVSASDWLGRRRILGAPPSRRLAAVLVGGLAIALLAPSLASYRTELANLLGTGPDGRLEVGASAMRRRATVAVGRWMRVHTPETAGWLDPAGSPEYGVLAPWEAGHALLWEAHRPTVIDNFGDDLGPENFELAERIYAGSEAEAMPLLGELRVRYVVVGASPAAAGGRAGPGSLLRSLYQRDGAELVGPEAGLARVAAAERHRLVYESPPAEAGDGALPLYKVFEVVAGARLEGFAPPGSRVELRIGLVSEHRRSGVYRASAVADASGRYAFRVPYATRRGPWAVQTGRRARLLCGDRTGRVAIPEDSVLHGGLVEGPDLRAGS